MEHSWGCAVTAMSGGVCTVVRGFRHVPRDR